MEYSVQKLNKTKNEITVKIAKDEWLGYQKEVYLKNKFKYSVEGFRKGKVPMNVLISRYGQGFFFEDALDLAVDKSYAEIMEKEKFEIVATPDFKVSNIGEEGVEFVISIDVKPEFELGEYTGLNIAKDSDEVTDEEIQKEIDGLLNSRARLVEKETPAELGDTVVIDYCGKKDGVAFDGGTAENQSLELGSHSFIPGFEEQLVGIKKDETRDIEVEFPKEYHAKDLAGQKAVFTVTAHDIQRKELPVFDDEFVKDVDDKLDTTEEYREMLKNKLHDRKAKDVEVKWENDIVDAIAEKTEVEIPDCMVEEELDYRIREMEYSMQQYGLKMEDYLKYADTTIEKIKEEKKEEAVRNVKIRLILEKICQKENITVTPEELKEKLDGADEKNIQQMTNYWANQIITDKLFKFLKENNTKEK